MSECLSNTQSSAVRCISIMQINVDGVSMCLVVYCRPLVIFITIVFIFFTPSDDECHLGGLCGMHRIKCWTQTVCGRTTTIEHDENHFGNLYTDSYKTKPLCCYFSHFQLCVWMCEPRFVSNDLTVFFFFLSYAE